jgi:hypothetical protein
LRDCRVVHAIEINPIELRVADISRGEICEQPSRSHDPEPPA